MPQIKWTITVGSLSLTILAFFPNHFWKSTCPARLLMTILFCVEGSFVGLQGTVLDPDESSCVYIEVTLLGMTG